MIYITCEARRQEIDTQAEKLIEIVENWRFARHKARDVVERVGSDEDLAFWHKEAREALDELIYEAKCS